VLLKKSSSYHIFVIWTVVVIKPNMVQKIKNKKDQLGSPAQYATSSHDSWESFCHIDTHNIFIFFGDILIICFISNTFFGDTHKIDDILFFTVKNMMIYTLNMFQIGSRHIFTFNRVNPVHHYISLWSTTTWTRPWSV
jgi:hypothetical protein